MVNQPVYIPGMDVKYAGWSNSDDFPFEDEGTSTLHHPRGDVMKFSSDWDEPVENDNSVRFDCDTTHYFTMNPGTLWVTVLDTGSIEPGSSGSPLFDPDNRVIGQLVGGKLPPACPPDSAWYAKFGESWDRSQNIYKQLKHWLNPEEFDLTSINTVSIPYITGHDFVCYSPNKTFTLHNRAAESVVWTTSSNLYIVSGQNTDALTVRAQSESTSGQGWVQANLYTGTCDVIPLYRGNIWVGIPTEPITSPNGDPDTIRFFLNTTTIITSDCAGPTYWSAAWPWIVECTFDYGCQGDFYSWSYGYAPFSVYTTNVCGNSPEHTGWFLVTCPEPPCYEKKAGKEKLSWKNTGQEKLSWNIFPNPAASYIDINIKETEENLIKDYRLEFILIPNSKVNKELKLNGSDNRINIQDLPVGAYLVRITLNSKVYRKLLIIQR